MVVTKLETHEETDVFVSTPLDLIPLLKEFYKASENDKECFVAIALNAQRKVLSIRTVTVGTVNKSLVHPREIFRYAVMENASAIIVSHNHPSGYERPSDEDIKTTNVIEQASQIMGIPLLDHIIIGDDYFSFREHGLLKD